jgi:peptidoglycan-N-acetylglucosamine deacetylase
MKLNPSFKQRLPWILLIIVTALLIAVLFNNRYPIFQKSLYSLEKIDIAWMGYTNQKVVALTFDDGPDPVYTPLILKILQRYHVPATFFVEGANVKKYPAVLREEIKNGHLIGNHTYTHPHLSTLSPLHVKKEIAATDQVVRTITSQATHYFRPPYEELTEQILLDSREQHKQIILSTVTLEHELAKTPRAKAERVIRSVFPGAIILAHDGRLNRFSTVRALPYLIRGLRAKGYRIISLKDLLRKRS